MKIESIRAYELFNALGQPTVACAVDLDNGMYTTATAPCDASGSFEAKDLRDADNRRLFGMGVHKAIDNIETIIAPALISSEPSVVEMDLKMIELDGTDDKSRLGANAMLAVSAAVLKAQALAEELEVYELIAHLCDYERITLPFAMFNLIAGRAHMHSKIAIQEYMIMPVGVDSFRSSLEVAATVFHACEKILAQRDIFFGVSDEGSYAAPFTHDKQALDLIMEVLEQTGTSKQVVIALDVAATQLYDHKNKTYRINNDQYTAEELIGYYEQLSKEYPLYSIADGIAATDWSGWHLMTKQLGDRLQIVGDNLFVTSPSRIAYGIEHQSANAVAIKPNQAGTITETLQAIKLSKDYGLNTIVSHCSGETNDTFLVDLAVGTSAGQLKAGGLMRGERIAKYNALLEIEDELIGSILHAY